MDLKTLKLALESALGLAPELGFRACARISSWACALNTVMMGNCPNLRISNVMTQNLGLRGCQNFRILNQEIAK